MLGFASKQSISRRSLRNRSLCRKLRYERRSGRRLFDPALSIIEPTNTESPDLLHAILSHFAADCHPTSVEYLGNAGGFSGARFWKLQTPRGVLCVRRWPRSHPSRDGLCWMHRVLADAFHRGCTFLPVPIPNRSGERLVDADDHLWEVSPWISGTPELATQRSPELLAIAMQTLARFHVASASYDVSLGPSGVVQQRNAFVSQLLSGQLELLVDRTANTTSELGSRCNRMLMLAAPRVPELPKRLQHVSRFEFSLQPCLRDIWHQHVLFQGRQLTGIVDFGAMRMETVATDIARLLGSLEGYIDDVWCLGIEAYQQIRPLTEPEKESIRVLDETSVILSGLNWVHWLMLEGRTFDNEDGVRDRLDDILRRLERLA